MKAHRHDQHRVGALLVGFVLYSSLLAAQTPAHLTVPFGNGTTQLNEPAVPPDRLELVTGDAQPVVDANERAETVKLVADARKHSNVRVQPYDLKTSFSALGTGSSDGSWDLEDVSPGPNVYRWTADGPGYSAVHLSLNRVWYSNRSTNALPVRLAQVRAAIFFTQQSLGPRASVRRASGNLDGVDLSCVLVAHNMMGKAISGGRSWDEAEYCVDSKRNTIATYSPLPGLYVRYDYANAIQFHQTLVPAKSTISQAGQIIVEARTISVTDPAKDEAPFQPAGLNKIGVGPAMSPPWHYHAQVPMPNGVPADHPQIVVVHGMQSPKGRLGDTELIASSNPSLNNSALQYASKWKAGPMGAVVEPGATPQSHQVFLTLQYMPQQNKQGVSSGQ
ncbi:MAG: hypothetical protein ACJ74Y_06350 [Bryobacteraceae bacterium]